MTGRMKLKTVRLGRLWGDLCLAVRIKKKTKVFMNGKCRSIKNTQKSHRGESPKSPEGLLLDGNWD